MSYHSNHNHLILLSGVGDPFLQLDVRCHCSLDGVLKFAKPNKNMHATYLEVQTR